MASPVPAPPPRRHFSFSGPILLISLGIVFLLGTMGYVNWSRLGHWFAHYWPLLLILAGVIKLIEYEGARRQGTHASGLSAGGILLTIMLIVFGLMATRASRLDWGEVRDQLNLDEGDFPWLGEKYEYEDQLVKDFPADASLHVIDTRGAVHVSSSNDQQIHVSVHKHIQAESQAEADRYNAKTAPEISMSGNRVTLNANNQGAGDRWVAEDLDIALPRKAAVEVSNRYGDVDVLGRDGDVTVSAQHNEVSATDIHGKVNLTLEHSSARVSQVSSDVSIEGRANDVSLEDVKGGAHLDGEFMETVKLANIGQSVLFKSPRTELQFSRLEGDLNLDSGDLQATNIIGPLRLTTRSKDVRLAGLSGDARLEDQNGSVEIRVKQLGSMQVEDRRGDVEVYLPPKAGFQVDARARGGDVETDFPELKVETSDNLASASGTVGSGGPHLIVNDDHGAIAIHKASGEDTPEPPKAPKPPKAAPAASPAITEN
ncbi:MAG TPA: DUF4097 family beta strand repeat-containing protein [Terriglobales bacterium]|nr:DUF4097 family beta strand repeat-containing protein [Terriglobales bacterium]